MVPKNWGKILPFSPLLKMVTPKEDKPKKENLLSKSSKASKASETSEASETLNSLKPLSLREKLHLFAKALPQNAGVYLMKNSRGQVIYVGKAKNLRKRVSSYFLKPSEKSVKGKLLLHHLQSMDYVVTRGEVEAFLLEASLIKKHRPRYNIRLKDDKFYPYIYLSWQHTFPRLFLTRRVVQNKGFYFGPYSSALSVRQSIRSINQLFQIRDCSDSDFKSRQRPCLSYQMGYCQAPCVGYVSESSYRKNVKKVLDFLRGKSENILKEQETAMRKAAKEEKFEVAARLRDGLYAIQAILEKQSVIDAESCLNQDAIGFFGNEKGSLLQMVYVRQGRVIGNRFYFFPQWNVRNDEAETKDWLVDFINQYYLDNILPDEILLSLDLGRHLCSLLQKVFYERNGRHIKVLFATSKKGQSLIQMACENAEHHFDSYVRKAEDQQAALFQLQKKLNLPQLPLRIECYDISHFQGHQTVASEVVFEEGLPRKDQYRSYNLQNTQGKPDDYASMYEVLNRRLKQEYQEEQNRPHLILVDGGKGQLQKACQVLKELDCSAIPVVAIAKARTEKSSKGSFAHKEIVRSEERLFLPHRKNPLLLPKNSSGLKLLTFLRDEAHRFALKQHRRLRHRKQFSSFLDGLQGIGTKKKQLLLKHFSSSQELLEAGARKIAHLSGFSLSQAQSLLHQLLEREKK